MINKNLEFAKPIADAYAAYIEKISVAEETFKTTVGGSEIDIEKIKKIVAFATCIEKIAAEVQAYYSKNIWCFKEHVTAAYDEYVQKINVAQNTFKSVLDETDMDIEKAKTILSAYNSFEEKVASAKKAYESNFKGYPMDLEDAKAVSAYVYYIEMLNAMQRAYKDFTLAKTDAEDAERKTNESVYNVACLGHKASEADSHASYVEGTVWDNNTHISGSDNEIISLLWSHAKKLTYEVKTAAQGANDLYSAYMEKMILAQDAYTNYVAAADSVAKAYKAYTDIASNNSYDWFLELDDAEDDYYD